MPSSKVEKGREPDYKVDRWDDTPLPSEPSGDPTSLSGAGGGMFTEMSRAFRLGLALSPIAILGAYGLAQWATGLVNSRAERDAIKDAIFYDDEALQTRRDRIVTDQGLIIEFKKSFAEIENPTAKQVADYGIKLSEREAKWRKQAIAYNTFRAAVIKQARQVGESEETFPKAVELDFDTQQRSARK